jgi:aspartokinase
MEVLMFSQSFSEHSLNLVVRQQDQVHCLNILCREFGGDYSGGWPDLSPNGEGTRGATLRQLNQTCNLGTREQVATVSVVGVPGWTEKSIVSHAFAALGQHDIRVIAVAQAATEYSVSFCVPGEQMADTVRLLHRELGLENGCE